jgi:hypothetical protein
MSPQSKSAITFLAFVSLGWSSLCLGQASPQATMPASPSPGSAANSEKSAEPPIPGSISGSVLDPTKALVPGAQLSLATGDSSQQPTPKPSPSRDGVTDGDGQFSFAGVPPGPFQLTVTAAGFEPQTYSGVLHAGETLALPPIALKVATNRFEVEVELTQTEVAQEQIKIEERQRVLGVLPNFYVSYIPDAAPLTAKQKFELAWKTTIDPVTLLFVAGVAGVEQEQNHFAEYGRGPQGYGKRFGAGYADAVAGTFLGAAVLPSLLKQDPRYFYKGTGSKRSRALYAIANTVICKGDNGRWQINYSNILGSFAAGGLSNLYYPRQDRHGAGLTLENAAIGIGGAAIGNLMQEFLFRKLTPKTHPHDASSP